MDPHTLYRRRDEFQILDVREDDEWAAGRIAGSLHIPLGELAARIDELDRGQPVVTVCRSGNRSGKAAKRLTRADLSAVNLDGGLKKWVQVGLDVTTPDGRPGRVV